jgi:Tol biopolymer transport system component
VAFSFGKGSEKFALPVNMPKDSCELFFLPKELNRFSVRDFALSPDKTELFITVESSRNTFSSILRFINSKDKWTMEIASFSGNYSDIEPTFSPDGNTLYFVSNRPLIAGGKEKDFDIWKVKKVDGTWSAPENIGAPVNTEANEFYPAIANNGNIYYTAQYKDGIGKEDIWMSKYENGKYTAPIVLSDSVNSKLFEFNAYVSPDESTIIFTSYGREDDMGGGDLYISRKNKDGKWQKAKNLGEKINSAGLDYCPFISFDKKMFVFTSDRTAVRKSYSEKLTLEKFLEEIGQFQNGKGNLYWIDAEEVLK